MAIDGMEQGSPDSVTTAVNLQDFRNRNQRVEDNTSSQGSTGKSWLDGNNRQVVGSQPASSFQGSYNE